MGDLFHDMKSQSQDWYSFIYYYWEYYHRV